MVFSFGVLVREALGGTLETQRELDHRCFRPVFVGQVDAVEVATDDLFDAPHIDKIEGKCTTTSLIYALEAVLLSQTLEFLRLPELGPWDGP